jgi:hypothetical protein
MVFLDRDWLYEADRDQRVLILIELLAASVGVLNFRRELH